MKSQIEPQKHENHGLSALRGWAMLLGVLLHALIPYLSFKIPGLLWPVHDPAASSHTVDVAYWIIHGFRVPLFFMLGGYFAFHALKSRAVLWFVKARLLRLGLPLIIGSVTIVFPLMYLIWGWGWIKSGLAEPKHLLHVRFEHGMQQDLYGFAHLWFLLYLLLYSVLLAVVIWCVRRWRGFGETTDSKGRLVQELPVLSVESRSRMPLVSWLMLVGLLSLGGLVVYLDPRCITSFHNWFWPRASEFFYHGSFFTIGVVLSASPWQRDALARWWWLVMGAGVASGFAFVHAAQQSEPLAVTLDKSVALSVWSPLFAGLTSIGLIHLCFGFARSLDPISKYLSERSFWIYVTHPPFVGLMQVLLYQVQMPVWIKIVSGFAAATACCIGLHAVWKTCQKAVFEKSSAKGKARALETVQPKDVHSPAA